MSVKGLCGEKGTGRYANHVEEVPQLLPNLYAILPSDLQYVGSYAFEDCVSLQTIEIPGSCTTIDIAAFYGCSGVTEVKLSEGITEIPGNMFCGCTGIKEISTEVFKGCEQLTGTIILPDSVATIRSKSGCRLWHLCDYGQCNLSDGSKYSGNTRFCHAACRNHSDCKMYRGKG